MIGICCPRLQPRRAKRSAQGNALLLGRIDLRAHSNQFQWQGSCSLPHLCIPKQFAQRSRVEVNLLRVVGGLFGIEQLTWLGLASSKAVLLPCPCT